MNTRRHVYYKKPKAMAAEVSRVLAAGGLTADEMARKLGVGVSYLHRITYGERPPSERVESELVLSFGADPRAFEKWEPEDLGLRVRAARAQLGLTAKALAELSGVSAHTLGNIERGRSIPIKNVLSAIAGVLVGLADEEGLVCDAARELKGISEANKCFEVRS